MLNTEKYILSKLPVYGSYCECKDKKRPIDEKIGLLNKIKHDLEAKIKENDSTHKLSDAAINNIKTTITNLDMRIEGLRSKISNVQNQAAVSAVGGVVGPLSNLIFPGSSILVNIGSKVGQSMVHNAYAEATEEQRHNLEDVTLDTVVKEAGKSVLRGTAQQAAAAYMCNII